MPETPKEKPACEPLGPNEFEKTNSWEDDQEKRGYYYDDAHGYEVYDPDSDEDELESLTKKPGDEHPA